MGRYQAYPEYKDSGVEWIGEIPTHWNLTKIRYVTECLDGKRVPLNATERGDMQGDIPYWGANSIVDHVNDWLFDEELVLIGEDGAPFFDRTKSVAFNVLGKVWPNNHVHVLRPIVSKINPKYLTYSLNNVDYHLYITGSTRDKLNQSDLNAIIIRYCPTQEQESIANFLDHETAKIDTLIEKQQQLIQLLKEKRQAVISHAVTKGLNPNASMKDSGVEWLGEVPEHWEVAMISSLSTKITNGYVGPTRDIFHDDGVRYLQSLHIKNNTIDFHTPYFVAKEWSDEKEKSILRYGDVLVVQTGDIGQVAAVTRDFIGCNCHALIIISPGSKIDGFFLSWVLNSDYGHHSLKAIQTGALHPHLNCGLVKTIKIAFPPISEQIKIVEFAKGANAKFDHLVSMAESQIELLRERRTALISAAVTGKIDVRNFNAGLT